MSEISDVFTLFFNNPGIISYTFLFQAKKGQGELRHCNLEEHLFIFDSFQTRFLIFDSFRNILYNCQNITTYITTWSYISEYN